MHLVHRTIRTRRPSWNTVVRWRLGLNRLFVRTLEWLTLCPKRVPLPQR
jgi:hypothetical protein